MPEKAVVFCAAVLSLFYPLHTVLAQEEQTQKSPALKADSAEETVYPDKESGDSAYRNKEFRNAAEFYRNYRLNAQKAGSTEVLQDAFEREIDALIQSGSSEQAEEVLRMYEKRFPEKKNSASVSLWKIHILLLKRQIDPAKEMLTQILKKLPQNDPLWLQAVSYIAFTEMISGNYAASAKYYEELAEKEGDRSLAWQSAERCALMLIAAGDTDGAIKKMKSWPVPNQDGRNLRAFKVLTFYLSLKKEAGSADVPKDWSDVSSAQYEKDVFFHMSFLLIADAFKEKKDLKNASQAYQLAYDTASSPAAASEALACAVDAMETFGETDRAASLAWQLYQRFHGKDYPVGIKLRIGTILCSAKRQEALDVYQDIFPAGSLKKSEEEAAFHTAIRSLLQNEMYQGAYHLTDLYYRGQTESVKYLLQKAEIKLAEKKEKEAADLYREAGKKSKASRKENYTKAIRLYAKLNMHDDVTNLCSILLLEDPQSPVIFFRAEAYDSKKESKKALADYQAYVELPPQFLTDREIAQAMYRIGCLKAEEGKTDEAIRCFETVFEKCRDSVPAPAAGCRLVYAYFIKNDEVKAEKIAATLSERYPDSEFSVYASLWLAAQYDPDNAMQSEDKLDKLIIPSKYAAIQAQALYEKTLLAFRKKDYAQTVRLIDELETKFPDSENRGAACYLHGDILMSERKFAEAKTEYEKAARYSSGSILEQAAWGKIGDCWFALMESSDSLQNYTKAIEAYEKITTANTVYSAMATYKIGCCLIELGRKTEAFRKYTKLLRVLPPKEAARHPAEAFWVVKGLEDLIGFMMRKNLMPEEEVFLDKALDAVDWLEKANILDREGANRRRNILNQNKRALTKPIIREVHDTWKY